MSAAGPMSTLRTVMPLMSMPRMAPATSPASSTDPASFTPPALPRPPTRTWALMTTLSPPARARNRSAAARASSTVWATSHSGTGSPWATSSDLASASWIFTGGGRLQQWGGRAMVPRSGWSSTRFRNEPGPMPRHTHRASHVGPPSPRGDMQRDLVERARKGDHDAFAELAGTAISRLDGAAWLILRDREQAMDAVQNTLVRAWRAPAHASRPRGLRRMAAPATRSRLHR